MGNPSTVNSKTSFLCLIFCSFTMWFYSGDLPFKILITCQAYYLIRIYTSFQLWKILSYYAFEYGFSVIFFSFFLQFPLNTCEQDQVYSPGLTTTLSEFSLYVFLGGSQNFLECSSNSFTPSLTMFIPEFMTIDVFLSFFPF